MIESEVVEIVVDGAFVLVTFWIGYLFVLVLDSVISGSDR